MANRQRGNNERISDLVFMDVPARLAKTLLNLGSRFGEPIGYPAAVPLQTSQQALELGPISVQSYSEKSYLHRFVIF